MFRRFGSGRDRLKDLERVEALVRDRFRLGADDLVLVSEDQGIQPGFPSLETNVIFWRGAERYRFRIFSPLAEIGAVDLPVAWLLPALKDDGDGECC